MTMTEKNASAAVVEELKKLGFEAEYTVVTKGNDAHKPAITLAMPGDMFRPVIYLEHFADYTVEETVQEIEKIYHSNKVTFDMNVMENWEEAKSHLMLKVVNAKSSGEYLSKVISRDVLDLAIVPCIRMSILSDDNDGSIGAVAVTPELLKNWKVTADEVIDIASELELQNRPAKIASIASVLKGMGMSDIPDEIENDCKMYVCSTKDRMHGAAQIFIAPEKVLATYPKLLRGCYILPSSIHEVIVIPDDGDSQADQLRNMVAEVNNTQVAAEEVLSYNVYYYANGNLSIA